MKLYLMRHGEAEQRAASDAARPLTARGWRQVEAVVNARRDELDELELVVASPYVRARQTAAGLLRALGRRDEPQISAQLTPNTPLPTLGSFITTCKVDSLLLVSHQPFVGAALAWLTGQVDLAEMGTADIAALDLVAFAPGGAQLRWLERAL